MSFGMEKKTEQDFQSWLEGRISEKDTKVDFVEKEKIYAKWNLRVIALINNYIEIYLFIYFIPTLV